MLRQEFGGGVDALEFRDLVQVSIAERFQDRLQRLVRSTDIDDDSVRVEAIGNERGVHHEGRAVERLRRTKHIAAKRMSDHDVIANFDREHWQTSDLSDLSGRGIGDELAEYATLSREDIRQP